MVSSQVSQQCGALATELNPKESHIEYPGNSFNKKNIQSCVPVRVHVANHKP